MSTIKVDLDPVFTKLISKLQNKTTLMKQISGIMLDEVHKNFEQQGRPPWRALSKKTIEARRRKGYVNPINILVRTGKLLKSVTPKSDNDSAQVGTNKIYAALHQFGGSINQAAREGHLPNRYIKGKKRGKFKKGKSDSASNKIKFAARSITIPPRPFLAISYQGIKDIEKTIVDYLKK